MTEFLFAQYLLEIVKILNNQRTADERCRQASTYISDLIQEIIENQHSDDSIKLIVEGDCAC